MIASASSSPADAPDRGPCPRLYAVARAQCRLCGHRWGWPQGAPTPTESPLVPVLAACPRCHRVVPLELEACGEAWWKACAFP